VSNDALKFILEDGFAHCVLSRSHKVNLVILNELLESVFVELAKKGLGLDCSGDKGSKV